MKNSKFLRPNPEFDKNWSRKLIISSWYTFRGFSPIRTNYIGQRTSDYSKGTQRKDPKHDVGSMGIEISAQGPFDDYSMSFPHFHSRQFGSKSIQNMFIT